MKNFVERMQGAEARRPRGAAKVAVIVGAFLCSVGLAATASPRTFDRTVDGLSPAPAAAAPAAAVAMQPPGPPDCNPPLDVVFVIDDTSSMGGAIDSVKAELVAILDAIEQTSDFNYQTALVTFKDGVQVDLKFGFNNRIAMTGAITALSATGGARVPEASDEALNTVINSLPPRPAGSDGFGGWRPAAIKVILLIKDALPGGFDDTFTSGVDDVNAGLRANEAAALCAARGCGTRELPYRQLRETLEKDGVYFEG